MVAVDARRQRWCEDDMEAATHLLERFWILRARDPEIYNLVYLNQNKLRHYFLEKCGFQLIVRPQFAKLEKVPAKAEAWMGIGVFQHPRDYALLCCLLAFLDEKAVDEQFLLSDLCEAIKTRYPSQEGAEPESARAPLSWEIFSHRTALVRVLAVAMARGLVNEVDGNIQNFRGNQGNEVLYEVTVLSRYFTISYPKDLFHFKSIDEILAAWGMADEAAADRRRKRVYRHLLLTPAYNRHQAGDEDFAYLRQVRRRLREDFEQHGPFQLELSKNTAMLTLEKPRAVNNVFPGRAGIFDLVLHFAAVVRQAYSARSPQLNALGFWELTMPELDRLLQICRERTGKGWSKEFREMSATRLQKMLLAELFDWQMARPGSEAGMLWLAPLLVRLEGRYPKQYLKQLQDGTHHDR